LDDISLDAPNDSAASNHVHTSDNDDMTRITNVFVRTAQVMDIAQPDKVKIKKTI
jgi:hypothetical protein